MFKWFNKFTNNFSFHGGLHLPRNYPLDHKTRSTKNPSKTLPLQPFYYLSLRQKDGSNQTSLVKVGDKVLGGQILTNPINSKGAILHSPTSGQIVEIINKIDHHKSQLPAPHLVLMSDNKDEMQLSPQLNQSSTKELLLERIEQSGIIGMGGAGFPSERKLNHQADLLIINAAECEPYITCDDMQIRECAAQIVQGALIAGKIINAKTLHFAIEDDKPEAIKELEKAINNYKNQSFELKLTIIKTKYPSGSAKQLIQLLTGKKIASQKHATDYGIVCHNSATLKAIADAVLLGKPLIERYVSVTGDIDNPAVYKAKIGTPIKTLIECCDNNIADNQILLGGAMMGYPISIDSSIEKTSNCLLILKNTTQKKEQPCIRCARCADACPMELLPQQLYWHSQKPQTDKLQQYRLFDCIECGICNSVCPSNIPLVQYYQHAKGHIRQTQIEQSANNKAKQRHENRQKRLEKEKLERETKMQARRAQLHSQNKANAEALMTVEKFSPTKNIDNNQIDIDKKTVFNPTLQNEANIKKQLAIENAKKRAEERRKARQNQNKDNL